MAISLGYIDGIHVTKKKHHGSVMVIFNQDPKSEIWISSRTSIPAPQRSYPPSCFPERLLEKLDMQKHKKIPGWAMLSRSHQMVNELDNMGK